MTQQDSRRRVIITFLGNRALPTTYRHNEVDYKGNVFAEALRQFTDYDLMLVCTTDEARKNTWPVLKELHDTKIEEVPIPTGRTTDEMWTTFGIITEKVKERDVVTFDITHGLRSLPFLVFLFAAYLKAAKKVTIDAIYYGALELGSSGPRPTSVQPDAKVETQPKPAPVIDLSEFVSMIDWITATERFVQTGSGEALANMLRDQVPPGPVMRTDMQQRELGKSLKYLAGVIEDTSASLAITHPLETMAQAANMERALSQAQSAISTLVKPFDVLAEQVKQAYAAFALGDAKIPANARANLIIQHDMIKWYIDKDQFVQAATLMREWLVSIGMIGIACPDLFDRAQRDAVEHSLNNLAERRKPKPRSPLTPHRDSDLHAVPHQSKLISLWIDVTVLRNDLAHCGMDLRNTKSAEAVANSIRALFSASVDIRNLFLSANT